MKAFLAAMAVAIGIAIGAVYVLDAGQRRADQAFSYPSSVSLPTHGVTHNLLGKDWYSAREH
jgi:hypothetical protein